METPSSPTQWSPNPKVTTNSVIHEWWSGGPTRRGNISLSLQTGSHVSRSVCAHIWALEHVSEDQFDSSVNHQLDWSWAVTPSYYYYHKNGCCDVFCRSRGRFPKSEKNNPGWCQWGYLSCSFCRSQQVDGGELQLKPKRHRSAHRLQILNGKTESNGQLPGREGLTLQILSSWIMGSVGSSGSGSLNQTTAYHLLQVPELHGVVTLQK